MPSTAALTGGRTASRRVALRQRLGLHRQADPRDRRRAGVTPRLHAGALAAAERHLGSVREDAAVALCQARDPTACQDRDGPPAGVVGGLQHRSPALLATLLLAQRVPRPNCLNPPCRLSGQTGSIPRGKFFPIQRQQLWLHEQIDCSKNRLKPTPWHTFLREFGETMMCVRGCNISAEANASIPCNYQYVVSMLIDCV